MKQVKTMDVYEENEERKEASPSTSLRTRLITSPNAQPFRSHLSQGKHLIGNLWEINAPHCTLTAYSGIRGELHQRWGVPEQGTTSRVNPPERGLSSVDLYTHI